jgi:hypothetical protein
MTVLVAYTRTLSKQLPARPAILTRLISTNPSPRVLGTPFSQQPFNEQRNKHHKSTIFERASRKYATTAKPATRTAAKPKKPSTKKAPAEKKAAPRKVTRKAASKKKPKKPKAKTKPQRLGRPVSDSPTAVKRRERERNRKLRTVGLVGQEPARQPETAHQLHMSQRLKGHNDVRIIIGQVGQDWRSISAEELEVRHTAIFSVTTMLILVEPQSPSQPEQSQERGCLPILGTTTLTSADSRSQCCPYAAPCYR